MCARTVYVQVTAAREHEEDGLHAEQLLLGTHSPRLVSVLHRPHSGRSHQRGPSSLSRHPVPHAYVVISRELGWIKEMISKVEHPAAEQKRVPLFLLSRSTRQMMLQSRRRSGRLGMLVLTRKAWTIDSTSTNRMENSSTCTIDYLGHVPLVVPESKVFAVLECRMLHLLPPQVLLLSARHLEECTSDLVFHAHTLPHVGLCEGGHRWRGLVEMKCLNPIEQRSLGSVVFKTNLIINIVVT